VAHQTFLHPLLKSALRIFYVAMLGGTSDQSLKCQAHERSPPVRFGGPNCETHERPRLSQDERFGLRTRRGLTQQLSLLLARAAAAGLSLASTELFLLRLMTTFLQRQEPSPTLVPLIKSADQTSSGTTETTGTMHSLPVDFQEPRGLLSSTPFHSSTGESQP
jgi:hypothetical protein